MPTNDTSHLPEPRPARSSRRATSYYNPFQTSCTTATDNPPSYAIAAKQKPAQRKDRAIGNEALPGYTCTVATEAKLWLNIESVNPLHGVAPSEWREIYLVLRGTMLSFHRAKDDRPGKLLRRYTLQHAEVGLATDIQHHVLVPQTKLAHLVPSSARHRAWQRDPKLFENVKQHAMRLRLETDQIVLATADENRIFALINAIGAGIDIACSIDERSIPRQCTVPRRRRRARAGPPADLGDPALLAEQERILREMYPEFAARFDNLSRFGLGHTVTTITGGDDHSVQPEPMPTPAQEEEELDFAAIREDSQEPDSPPATRHGNSGRRPPAVRMTTDASMITTYSAEMMHETSPENFNSSGKWQPPHTRTEHQVQRYIKRCMPTLSAEAVRASDVLICNGKRFKINWRMELLEGWELQPPSYRSHGFAKAAEIEPAQSIAAASLSGSAAQTNAQTSTSVLGVENDEQVATAETGLASLALSKVNSLPGADKVPTRVEGAKQPAHRRAESDMQGIVFCF